MTVSNPEFEIICEIVGDELAKQIQQQIGGCKVYIPAERKIDKQARDALMISDYAFGGGLTTNQLAIKYGLSEPHARIIVRSHRRNTKE